MKDTTLQYPKNNLSSGPPAWTPRETSKASVLYTLGELGRRAGAAPEWIAGWHVQFKDRSLILHPEPLSPLQIVFPLDRSKPARFEQLMAVPPISRSWMEGKAPHSTNSPDLLVFFDDGNRGGEPLFVQKAPNLVECRSDVLTSALWTLSRAEEFCSVHRDQHGRFPASASVLSQSGCLARPIVDEYGLAFRQALLRLFPRWTPKIQPLRLKLSHDIDLVGLPRNLRSTVGHLYPRRLPRAFLRDIFAILGAGIPAYLEAVRQTARISAAGGFDSAFYWKASGRTAWDSGYSPEHPDVAAVIRDLSQNGMEMGVHPGYRTFDSYEELESEIDRLRRTLGKGPIGGRQHFLRWHPRTWLAWERAGLAYDSSLAFADVMGFRAGTAIPYHPWLLDENRVSQLLEIPLVVMDCTPVEYMHLSEPQTLAAVADLVQRCEDVGGVFALLWHNSSVIEHPYAAIYPKILDLFHSRHRYDWRFDLPVHPTPLEQAD